MPSRSKKQVRPRSIRIRRLKTDTFTRKRKVVKSEMSEPGDLSKTGDRVNKNGREAGNISNSVDPMKAITQIFLKSCLMIC